MNRDRLKCGLMLAGLGVLMSPAAFGKEVVWARGSADGNQVGRYADADNWDGGSVPGPKDRARVDRGGTVMTIDSTVAANDFLFGVNEPGQTFKFTSNANVRLNGNYFVAFNRGDVTVEIEPGAKLTLGSSLILGQDNNPGNDDEDIIVKIAGDVTMKGGIILGLRYDGDGSDVDLRVEISGTVRTDNILIANEENQGGDKQAFLDPARNNSAMVLIAPTGELTLIGNKDNQARQLIGEGILRPLDPEATLEIGSRGSDTVIVSSAPEPE